MFRNEQRGEKLLSAGDRPLHIRVLEKKDRSGLRINHDRRTRNRHRRTGRIKG
jgi:hypothetical protein